MNIGHNIFSTCYLSEEIKLWLSTPKMTADNSTIWDKKCTLIQDISYFQRLLILHRIFHNKDDEAQPPELTPLVENKSYNFVPCLPVDSKNEFLTICLNYLETLKSVDWVFTEPVPQPHLPAGLIALPSDKGGLTVVFPKKDYIDKMEHYINTNSDVYEQQKVSNASNDHFTCNKVLSHIKTLSDNWHLLKKEKEFVNFPRLKLPKMRGSPKFHKLVEPYELSKLSFRPIISGKGGPLCGISILLDKLLRPVADLMDCRIKDSFDAIDKIGQIDFSTSKIQPYDATSLYTSFDVELAITAAIFWINNSDMKKLIPNRFHDGVFIKDAIKTLFTMNFFSFNNNIYLQKNGLAMGTESAVVLAEIILGFLEHKHNLSPPEWVRYIDDGLKVFKKSANQQNYMEVITSLNSMDNKIKWTTEPDEDVCEFLDLKINQKSGNISTFHKKTASFGNYVPWKSSHATHQKLNIAFNLFYRAARINSDNISLQLEITRIERSLMSLGYPIKSIRAQKTKLYLTKKYHQSQNKKRSKQSFSPQLEMKSLQVNFLESVSKEH